MKRRGAMVAAIVGGVTMFVAPLLARTFVVEAFRIPAGSMIPTIGVGDHVFVSKWGYTPRAGDVVVFRYPKDPSKDFIKRIVAVAGDTVEWRAGVLYLGGQPVVDRPVDGPCHYVDFSDGRRETRECRAVDETLAGQTFRLVRDPGAMPRDFPLVTVPPGHVYVLGDNRDNSHDSRFWGTVPVENIKGRYLTTWWKGPR